MLITLHNWQDDKDKFLSKLKSKRLIRHVIIRVWNRDSSFKLGHFFSIKMKMNAKSVNLFGKTFKSRVK